ncbi:MAG: dUTP diphosphatase [Candidatus Yanofskybacteria bacterium]|nr:dUTP diphosphatase [Candidatus Yanofskybacteria bacterium]
MHLKLQRLHPAATLPSYANPGDAGMDLHTVERVLIRPGASAVVATGIAVALPRGCVGLIWDKSGLATKHGLKVMGGVIDEGYRGEIKVGLVNLGTKRLVLEPGHKVAQMLVQRVSRVTVKEVPSLSSTRRGAKGFGSSGIK